jgi:succinate dehydrogenase/fumarate reductase flavoprotein subunit
VMIDEEGRTSLPGLYAAGDVIGGSMMSGATGALVWGYVEGINAAHEALESPEPTLAEDQVLLERERVLGPLTREEGVKPLELENTVRKLVTDYVGFQKHESKLNHCLEQLNWIREEYVPQLQADNPHELMRAIEVQSIIDVGELHARSALIRTESRLVPWHYRVDYPRRDDEKWQKALLVWEEDGQFEYTVGGPWNQ